jgi:hypothetical protein
MVLITMNIEKDERRAKMPQSKEHFICDNKTIEYCALGNKNVLFHRPNVY